MSDDLVVYDKAKYHYEGKFPAELDRSQAYVYPGVFFGWICARQLFSPMIAEDFEPELQRFRDRSITAATLFRLLGGTLASDMLSTEGKKFTDSYYSSHYVDDYHEVLGLTLPTLYHAEDGWQNFDLMAKRLDQRFGEWLKV